jgi:hypothetical protein
MTISVIEQQALCFSMWQNVGNKESGNLFASCFHTEIMEVIETQL